MGRNEGSGSSPPKLPQMLSPTYKQRNEDFRKLFSKLPEAERLIVGESPASQSPSSPHCPPGPPCVWRPGQDGRVTRVSAVSPLGRLRLLLCLAARDPPPGPPLSLRELDLLLQQHLPLGNSGKDLGLLSGTGHLAMAEEAASIFFLWLVSCSTQAFE